MKTKTLFLFSFILIYSLSYSQFPVRPLTIGDTVPDLVFNKLINYSKPSLRFSDFKGKALLLDFWAPWCVPCITAFPKLDSLQKEFNNSLLIIPVTKESQSYAGNSLKRVVEQKGISLNYSVVDDTLLSKLFKHSMIPHYVGIDKNRVVKGIMGPDELTQLNLSALTSNKALALPIKTDTIMYNLEKPLFSYGQVKLNKEDIVYQSTLTKYIQGVYAYSTIKKNWIVCTDHSMLQLYKIAFGEFDLAYLDNRRIVLEGFETEKDSLEIGMYTTKNRNQWKSMYRDVIYNYELYFSDSIYSSKEKIDIMQMELNKLFLLKGIHARKENRQIKVLALVRTSDKDKLKTKSAVAKNEKSLSYINISNSPLASLISDIQLAHQASEMSMALIDETGYSANVDIEIKGDISNLTILNSELAKYDLKIVEKEQAMDMIVITKKDKN